MFDDRIIKLVNKAFREGWTAVQFETELNKLLFEMNYDNIQIEKIKTKLEEMMEFITANYIGLITDNDVKTIISQFSWKLHKTTKDLTYKLTKAFTNHKHDVSYDELYDEVKGALGAKSYYANTIINTTMAGVDQIQLIAKVAIAGKGKEPLYRYLGPPAERPFCKERLNKVYTLTEIKMMDNGQGLPVMFNCGGYNCRHQWVFAGYKIIK